MLVDCCGGKCCRCGYNKNYSLLDFHHIKDKKYNISDMTKKLMKISEIIKECKKCILLCKNCHSEFHSKKWFMEDIKPVLFNEKYLPWKLKDRIRICSMCGREFYCLTKSDLSRKACSRKCSGIVRRKIIRPTKQELEKMVWNRPTTLIARDFNVSDKTISKWCLEYNIGKPPRGYWSKTRQ